MTKEELQKIGIKDLDDIREFVVDNIIRDDRIMLFDEYRGAGENGDIDLPYVIASLYEVIHRLVTGKDYTYMFHWANKVGSYVGDDLFLQKGESPNEKEA